jgi:hypothetical protein
MRVQNPILRREVPVLQRQFLIDHTGRVGQQAYPYGYLSSREFIIKPAFLTTEIC